VHALAALWAAAQACVSADAGRALGSSTGLALLFGDVCARFQAAEEGHVRRRLNLVAELLIGLATHAGWSLRQRVEEVAVVSQARSQSVGSESGPAFRVLALALVDQAAAVPTQKVGGGGADAELRRQRVAEAAGQVRRDAAGRLQPGTAPIREIEESWRTSFKRWFKDGGQPAAEACRATVRLFNKLVLATETAIDQNNA